MNIANTTPRTLSASKKATLMLLTASLVLITGCLSQDEEQSQAAVTLPADTTVAPHVMEEIAVAARKQQDHRVRQPMTTADAAHEVARFERMHSGAVLHSPYPPVEPTNRENYAHIERNPLQLVSEQPVSTFSIDVDTASYANVRRMLNDGYLPPQDAVRVEEMINYFSYNYESPTRTSTPFSVNTELTTTPWNADTRLLQIGLQGYNIEAADRPDTNLVFLLDVSGSMNNPDKLPLLKRAFGLLTKQMTARDRVSIVVYAGASGIVLEPTPGNQKATIMTALDRLSAGGSTNGAAGINLAYQMAQQGFINGGINRVVLATDGDFNVGTVNFEALIDMVEERREQGISLTTLGFGTGNYNDQLMEQLADKGNGNYAYIDNINEAHKVLVEELSATLQTIAKDVKIQVEFNPQVVAEYRLIGYENRMLRREDFNNDRIDAGEIGAGHTVTALYEVSLVGGKGRLIDPLRYGTSNTDTTPVHRAEELAQVRLRYKAPGGDTSQLLTHIVNQRDIVALNKASDELRFAAAVAAFGQQLRGGEYLQGFGYTRIGDLANKARGTDDRGYRGEFVSLVRLAESLSATTDNAVVDTPVAAN